MTEKEYNDRYASNPVLRQFKEIELKDVLKVVNCSYIAKRFFGKSSSWFYQRLHHHMVNGKPAEFTPEERKTLSDAFATLGLEFMDLSDRIE